MFRVFNTVKCKHAQLHLHTGTSGTFHHSCIVFILVTKGLYYKTDLITFEALPQMSLLLSNKLNMSAFVFVRFMNSWYFK